MKSNHHAILSLAADCHPKEKPLFSQIWDQIRFPSSHVYFSLTAGATEHNACLLVTVAQNWNLPTMCLPEAART